MKKQTLNISARKSDLARLQARLVGEALLGAQTDLAINYEFRSSLGDQRPDEPLWQMSEKGVFTQDLRSELLEGRCDLVVHSWKDLPIEEHPETCIAATLPRADARDLLLVNKTRWHQVCETGQFTVLTSSPRRAQNLREFLPLALPASIKHIEFQPVRGTIQTRIEKLFTQSFDALIVAKAALDRLLAAKSPEFAQTRDVLRAKLDQCFWMVLPLRLNPTAPGQGALAIEARRENQELLTLLAAINCQETFESVERERAILRGYGGGCHQAIGASVLGRAFGEIHFVRGLDQTGATLQIAELHPARSYPSQVPPSALWPLHNSQNRWFERQSFLVIQPASTTPLWIAKDDALPGEWQIPLEQIVWVSGWKTWRKLAARGVWVHGCAENIGEAEDPNIETLAGQKSEWLKLTHDNAISQSGMKTLQTYHLSPANTPPAWEEFETVEYCFWTSGSAFMRALALYPALRERKHFCGPGATLATLREAGIEPFICLDYEHWLSVMKLT